MQSAAGLLDQESLMTTRIAPELLAHSLLDADVISFDIFDTLVYRYFNQPDELFYLLGLKLNIMNFHKYRVEAEHRARLKALNRETTLNEIYQELQDMCGLDPEKGMRMELDLESKYIFANPYILRVYQELVKCRKTIVAVSDMYLPSVELHKILTNLGYTHINKVYVSCEHRYGKGTGELQKHVQQMLFPEAKVVHIGDNWQSDILASQNMGWGAFHIATPRQIGEPFRPTSAMSPIIGSLYRGLVNTSLHNGLNDWDPHFEHGFVYGGILMYGFAQWLEQFAQEKKIDKFLFVSRDGDIVRQVYNRYFGKVPNEYVMLSRYSSQMFAFERYTEDFIDHCLRSRAYNPSSMTIAQAFTEIGLSDMIGLLKSFGIRKTEKLDPQSLPEVEKFIYHHRLDIAKIFRPSQEAAFTYFKPKLDGCKRVAVVDVGWRGTGGLYLRYLLNERYQMPVEILNVMAAAGIGDDSANCVAAGINHAFMFSSNHNRDLYWHHTSQQNSIHSCLIELLFMNDQPSFQQFSLTPQGDVDLIYAQPEEKNHPIARQIQSGILAFCDQFHPLIKDDPDFFHISGADAAAPIDRILDAAAYQYQMFQNYEFQEFPGKRDSLVKKKTMGMLMKEWSYFQI